MNDQIRDVIPCKVDDIVCGPRLEIGVATLKVDLDVGGILANKPLDKLRAGALSGTLLEPVDPGGHGE